MTRDRVAAWIDDIAALPADLRRTVSPLTDGQLDTPYRPGGWTVRKVVHHLADSHMNSYVRFKLALTEDRPVIKAYDEKSWAELPDSQRTGRFFARSPDRPPRPLGGSAAQPELGTTAAGVRPPGVGRLQTGGHRRGLRLARPASSRARGAAISNRRGSGDIPVAEQGGGRGDGVPTLRFPAGESHRNIQDWAIGNPFLRPDEIRDISFIIKRLSISPL